MKNYQVVIEKPMIETKPPQKSYRILQFVNPAKTCKNIAFSKKMQNMQFLPT